MSKNKKTKRYLFEEVLDFLKHNSSKTFNYKQLGAAMEINTDGERLQLIETLENLKLQGFVIENEIGKYQIKETKQANKTKNASNVVARFMRRTTHKRRAEFLHLCTFKTPIIYTSFLDFYEFYFLEHIFHFYYKHLPKCSYNILLV
jgi:predicted AAA+ superfamily ATPase